MGPWQRATLGGSPLALPMTAGATSCTLTSGATFPAAAPFAITFGDAPVPEVVWVTIAPSGNLLSGLVRAAEGPTPATQHLQGTPVISVETATTLQALLGVASKFVLVNATGTGSAQVGSVSEPYAASPGQTVFVDATYGPVAVQLPTLVFGQPGVRIKHLASTSLATYSVSIVSPAGVAGLEQPAPNNALPYVATFTYGGSSLGPPFGGDTSRGMLLEYINGGSSAGYSLL